MMLQVYTIGDRTEMEVYVPSAVGSCRFYDQSSFDSLDLTEKLEISCSKVYVPNAYIFLCV